LWVWCGLLSASASSAAGADDGAVSARLSRAWSEPKLRTGDTAAKARVEGMVASPVVKVGSD
jgi:hypothetical protein